MSRRVPPARAPHRPVSSARLADDRRAREHATYETADKVQKLIMEHTAAAFAGARRRPTSSLRSRTDRQGGDRDLELAEDVGADLIFVGSHGKTGVERLVLGSVSERIMPRRSARDWSCVQDLKDIDLMKVSFTSTCAHRIASRTSTATATGTVSAVGAPIGGYRKESPA